ncbi:VOC family protein [Haloplanus natans]|uniref:VOC family protein n=1 Tax=Haloplanus natans TaxID=376171 RepID=UPI00067815AD|nr:VOC family protein [Haloplanus natans]
MITKIDHLGVLVSDIDANEALFELLGLDVGAVEHVPAFGVDIAFIRVGESLVELVEPVDHDSDIAADLRAADDDALLHHVAYRVEDIEAELETLRAAGVPLADETPRRGAGDARVAFLDPAAANGVRVELVERPSDVALD